MDRPFDMKLNGESIKLPKYIKSKVYYVKGWNYPQITYLLLFIPFIFLFIYLRKSHH